jgi:hypothetical protein
MIRNTEERARKSIVLALKERRQDDRRVDALFADSMTSRAPSLPPRPPANPVDLDADLEDFIDRYRKTLEYLAR